MKREPRLYLDDILEALTRIEKYVENMSFHQFSEDQKTIDAVVRNFEITGEASKQVSDDIKAKYPDIPWQEMSGMRDKLIHAYFGVNLDIIWETITTRVHDLKSDIQNILEAFELKE